MDQNRTIIEPASHFSFHWKELWQYRELFYFFTWRDIKIKYKQTFLGILWAFIQPLALVILFTFVFGHKLGIETGGVRYEVFVLSGLIIWTMFQSSVNAASDSILRHAHMINKIYFPRMIMPLSALLVSVVDFAFMLLIFLVTILAMKETVSVNAFLYFPLAIITAILTSAGICLLVSALVVKYRDVKHMLPFLLQLLFFSSAVLYPLESIETDWFRYLLALNPVNAPVQLMQIPLTLQTDPVLLSVSLGSSVLFGILGLYYFKKTEAFFADFV